MKTKYYDMDFSPDKILIAALAAFLVVPQISVTKSNAVECFTMRESRNSNRNLHKRSLEEEDNFSENEAIAEDLDAFLRKHDLILVSNDDEEKFEAPGFPLRKQRVQFPPRLGRRSEKFVPRLGRRSGTTDAIFKPRLGRGYANAPNS